MTLARYGAVDDYGVLVNPMVASGQVHGAIAQGAGQALLEEAHYDTETGQLLSGSLMDYALPRADDLPSFALGFNPTRCTTNPLGVKGAGEAGAVAAFPAIGNAIRDALRPFGAADSPARRPRNGCGGHCTAASVLEKPPQTPHARFIPACAGPGLENP